MRAMIMKSSVRCASLPARIFSEKCSIVSCCCSTSVPKSEFLFSPILSSKITAETPMRSNVCTW